MDIRGFPRKNFAARWLPRLQAHAGTVAFLAPALLLLILGIFSYVTINRELNELADSQLRREVRLAKSSIDDRLTSVLNHIKGHRAELSEGLATGDRVHIAAELTEMTVSETESDHSALTSPGGIDLAHYPPDAEPSGINYTNTHWWKDYVAGGRKPFFSDVVDLSDQTGGPLIVFAAPIDEKNPAESEVVYSALRLRAITTWLLPFQIGDSGGLVLVDRHHRVVVSSAALDLRPGDKYERCHDCLTTVRMIEGGWGLHAVVPRSEIRASVIQTATLPIVVGVLLMLVSAVIGYTVSRLSREIRQRELDLEYERTRAVSNLTELESGLLPSLHTIPGWEIGLTHASATVGAKIGGDFFDAFPLADGRLAVVIGDVSGKGLSAAAIANTARTACKAFFQHEQDPARVLASLNNYLTTEIPREMFVTLQICIAEEGQLVLTTAGHPPPLTASRDPQTPGRSLRLPAGLPLGAFPDAQYTSVTVEMPPGVVVALYTDGLIEARGSSGLLGMERSGEALQAAVEQETDVGKIALMMRHAAEEWSGGELKDDIGVIVFKKE